MNLVDLLFYFFGSVAGLAAIGILISKNVFKAALLLLVCLLAVAALYVLAVAEFIAIVQILIYAGGILVIIIFGIMLTTKISGKPLVVNHTNLISGILAGSASMIFLANLIANYAIPPASATALATGNLQGIGINLVTHFALPFEISGILLLITLVGAAATASSVKSKKT